MPIQIEVTAEAELLVGEPTVIDGEAIEGPFVAIFEDDGTTGYFYALDISAGKQPIQDAVQIYNVANVTDGAKPSVVKIGWSADSQKVMLLINKRVHAIFDFSAKQGYCRTGFPPAPSNGIWSKDGHDWQEAALQLFA